MFEARQHKKGLVKFVDRKGNERWGKPEEIKNGSRKILNKHNSKRD